MEGDLIEVSGEKYFRGLQRAQGNKRTLQVHWALARLELGGALCKLEGLAQSDLEPQRRVGARARLELGAALSKWNGLTHSEGMALYGLEHPRRVRARARLELGGTHSTWKGPVPSDLESPRGARAWARLHISGPPRGTLRCATDVAHPKDLLGAPLGLSRSRLGPRQDGLGRAREALRGASRRPQGRPKKASRGP